MNSFDEFDPSHSKSPRCRVLVFPCGSESGLEIGRSLDNVEGIELIGGSSVDDHGRFVFSNYIGGLPFVNQLDFIDRLNSVVRQRGIDLVYPAMDSVVAKLAAEGSRLNARVVGSSPEVAAIALSKRKTYQLLAGSIRCPREYSRDELRPEHFPVLLKPEIGYGSRGVVLAHTPAEVDRVCMSDPTLMILEYLPGSEYTVDCFTNFKGQLLFASPRERCRISRGISVNTVSLRGDTSEFSQIAERINQALPFNGGWFFQVKRGADGQLALLEIAPRIAGSMGLHRCKGVNLPLLSVLNELGIEVSIFENTYEVEYDRALYSRARLSKTFSTLYLAFEGGLLRGNGQLDPDTMKLVVQFRNANNPVILLARHSGNVDERLNELGIRGLFARVVRLHPGEDKADFIEDGDGILVDDSFAEQKAAREKGIAALSVNMIEALLE